ncbi:glucose 1-dehydrogenase [Chelatococcus sp. SYSU_G07232]|uniref:Glucose 1-dehydrogenase n=1 Tax=Chelatococcus albus TaxID=3047466 RepID=A0ABT7AHA4_9HYPH|nr:glucose 1-dehydrogenase [Chelatococcus sp. SYSU_G07232]MDJ1158766.1 glucose 1-dehydrogenase [Chelatococcus sp. SYSU_G07232]
MSRILLVTGGSRGIGAATCRLAAARGYDVAVNYVTDRAAAEAVAAECRAAGVRALVAQGDTSREAEVGRILAAVDEGLGRLTHLVNNAGVTGRVGRLDETDPAVIRHCIDVNVTGALLVAREAVKRMAPRHGGQGGAIVNVSSVAADLGSPGEYVWYAASKGAVNAMTIGLARELAAENIRVNAVAPGLVETEIHERSSAAPERLARLAPMIPMGRAGRPEEIAETILYLLSDAASYVTGAVLRASGGR